MPSKMANIKQSKNDEGPTIHYCVAIKQFFKNKGHFFLIKIHFFLLDTSFFSRNEHQRSSEEQRPPYIFHHFLRYLRVGARKKI
jgi:hypothetical protein